MATHSSILAWRIPWTDDPGGLQSTGLQGVEHDWVTSLHFTSVQYAVSKLVKLLSRVQLFPIPLTVVHQASPSMGFSRQEYWSGLPFPSPAICSRWWQM